MQPDTDLFIAGCRLVKDEFFLDAIDQFENLVRGFPVSELADDAVYNIALCYFELNQFERAIERLKALIAEYPDAMITDVGGGNEHGRTAAKAYLLLLNCHLALGDLERSKEIVPLLEEYPTSFVVVNGEGVPFSDLGKIAIARYGSMGAESE
jgi:tetratricopeptide (TPR) repeat protein